MELKEIEDFYRRLYHKKVKVITYTLNGDGITAEDVVQEAFERVIRYRHIFNGNRAGFETWFNSIMFNVLWDMKKQSGQQPKQINKNATNEDALEYNMLQVSPEFRSFLLKKLHEVDNYKHRKVLQLFFLFGYSSPEISGMGLGVSQTNVTTIINRFREKLL